MDYTVSQKLIRLGQKFNSIEDAIKETSFRYEITDQKLTENEKESSVVTKRIDTFTELRGFLSEVSAEYRIKICHTFNNLLTEALSRIFVKNIKFEILLENYRNQPAIEVRITEDDNVLDPQKSSGGGMNDIISLIFKIIFVYLRDCSNIIILDESLKFLSKEYLQNASDFLRDICDRLEMQIILVSHKDNLQASADNVISIDKINSKSVIL